MGDSDYQRLAILRWLRQQREKDRETSPDLQTIVDVLDISRHLVLRACDVMEVSGFIEVSHGTDGGKNPAYSITDRGQAYLSSIDMKPELQAVSGKSVTVSAKLTYSRQGEGIVAITVVITHGLELTVGDAMQALVDEGDRTGGLGLCEKHPSQGGR